MRMAASSSSSNDRKGHLQAIASILLGAALPNLPPPLPKALAIGNDEYDVSFDAKQPLGLALEDFGGTNGKYRTYVSKTLRGSQATGKGIRIPALVVAVNGRNVEGLPRKLVVQLIREAQEGRSGMGGEGRLVVTFRDPAKFMELLVRTFGCVCLCTCWSRLACLSSHLDLVLYVSSNPAIIN